MARSRNRHSFRDSCFTRCDRAAGWTVFGVALALYVHSLPPTVTLEDAGELIVAADHLGVPHPPGYPLWTMLNALFCRLFAWIRFYGQPDSSWTLIARSLREGLGRSPVTGVPNPAWAVAFSSALFGALACGILALLMRRAGADALRRAAPGTDARVRNRAAWTAAVSSGLLLAFSPVFWSQSVIAEVYSLNAFFLALILALLYRWIRRPENRRPLVLLGLCFGWGLTNHHTLLFFTPALALAVLARAPRLFGRFLAIALCWAGLILGNGWALRSGYPGWAWTAGPAAPAFWIYTALFFLVPLLAGLGDGDTKTAGLTCVLLLLGLALYLYLPLASRRNPPMNWGYARSWEGFLRLIGRGQYEPIQPAHLFSRLFIGQVSVFLNQLRMQFSFPLILIGILPFCAWSVRGKSRRIQAFPIALALVALSIGLTAPAALVRLAGPVGESVALGMELGIVLCLFLLVLTGLFGGAVLFLFTPPISRGLAVWGVRPSARVRFEAGIGTQLGLAVLATGFFFLGVVFLAVQNLPLDAYHQFVGRVQFIPAYALFALSIGAGLLGALSFVLCRIPDRPGLHRAVTVLVLALPLAPLWENAFNPDRVRLLGAAEQSGHDFGWAYGTWMLRGAEAIREAIPPEEWAEYPTPGYPPPLDPDAILFGGSDAGRFVPTYLVFSAGVRPDVFVLTQNALADPFYMAALRDLYGARIRLPSRAEEQAAFHRILTAMETEGSGAGPVRRAAGDTAVIKGIDRVMAINAILARHIFEANRVRHSLYIEDSYPIPWMAAYQEPHGLLFRLHPEPVSLRPERVRDDRLFWEWVTRRLTGNPRFLRDASARRAFAGARTAIADYYLARGLEHEAEIAYAQALILSPLYTVAGHRLADLYLRDGRVDHALHLLGGMVELDPLNPAIWEHLDTARALSLGDGNPGARP